MLELQLLLVTHGLAPRLKQPGPLAGVLALACEMEVYPNSLVGHDRVLYFLARSRYDKHLGLVCDALNVPPGVEDFEGTAEKYELQGIRVLVKLCPRNHANAQALRARAPFLAPRRIGLAPSFGFGDRLGMATPGHIHALGDCGLMPVFAQQSVREMTRTGRSPEEVFDDATWGVMQENYRGGYGADADHLKTTEDVEACAAAGFTMFTVDPGEHVDDEADAASGPALAERAAALPWDALETSLGDWRAAYLGRSFALDGAATLEPSEDDLLRAAAKYGRAIAHTVRLYRRLAELKGDEPFELEVSVDETASPTSPFEHYFVASELKRLGVRWVSLAPRFVGRFEKGVDYQGDLGAFEESFARHVAVARTLGPYKLSLHSGSDKFSVYPIVARLAGELVHVKTAGTSYLEALRAIAMVAPELFREIVGFACEHYEADRASYHVSAEAAKVPPLAERPDGKLATLLDDFHARQVLHVSYGSVLNAKREDGSWRFRERLLDALRRHEEVYGRLLAEHLGRHVAPFRKGPTG